MAASSKRPEHVAWASLILSVVLFGVVFFLGRWSGFYAVSAVSWQILAAGLVWLVLAIQFHQRVLAEQERLDVGQLGKTEGSSTIFEPQPERAQLFAVAQRRLKILEKWFVPIFAVVIAVYQLAIAIVVLNSIPAAGAVKTQQPLVCAIATTAVAFVTFLMSRYATGMSGQIEWKPLRAGGSYFLGVALMCFAIAIGLALAHFHRPEMLTVLRYVVPIVLIVVGVEIGLNVVLDVYRPRLKGQYSRAAFDSRLLGLFNEPGGLFRSVAGAIDYQFGFEVSETWFYKLLQMWILPLVLFSCFTLYLASCMVVVESDEEVIIERFGNPLDARGQIRKGGPGLHWKLPWPIDKAYKHATQQVMELYIGFEPQRDQKTDKIIREPLLWGKEHYETEHSVLVASEDEEQDVEGTAPVSLIKANIPVQYKIRDLYSYIYKHKEPSRLIEAICYRELARYAASAQIGLSPATLKDSLFGAGRADAKNVLSERIQAAAEEHGLGVEFVFVGVQGIHPPPEVAGDYQEVVGAVQSKQEQVLAARMDRNKQLSELIGSVARAYELYALAKDYQLAEQENRTEDVQTLGKQLDEAFAQASGEVFATLRAAQSYAFEKATQAKAAGDLFRGKLEAFRAAPQVYKREQRLTVLEEALAPIRKYVVVAGPSDVEIITVDLQEQGTPDLWKIGGIEESSQP